MKTIRSLLLLILATLPLHAALPGADALAGLITKQFDTNADTILDAGEWQAGIEKGFQEIDSNGDGSITAAELDALADPIGNETGEFAAKLVTVLIKQVVLTMDSDKDGSVSLKEYTAQATSIFTKLDTSKSGSVEQAELPTKLIGA